MSFRGRGLLLGVTTLALGSTVLVALRAEAPAPRHPALLILAPLRLPAIVTAERAEPLPAAAVPGERVRVTLTAYCLKGTTALGLPVGPGLVAADPRVFPLGRHVNLFVGDEYLGRFHVGDTGGVVLGTVLDVWMEDCGAAIRFGRRRGWAVLLPQGDSAAP